MLIIANVFQVAGSILYQALLNGYNYMLLLCVVDAWIERIVSLKCSNEI